MYKTHKSLFKKNFLNHKKKRINQIKKNFNRILISTIIVNFIILLIIQYFNYIKLIKFLIQSGKVIDTNIILLSSNIITKKSLCRIQVRLAALLSLFIIVCIFVFINIIKTFFIFILKKDTILDVILFIFFTFFSIFEVFFINQLEIIYINNLIVFNKKIIFYTNFYILVLIFHIIYNKFHQIIYKTIFKILLLINCIGIILIAINWINLYFYLRIFIIFCYPFSIIVSLIIYKNYFKNKHFLKNVFLDHNIFILISVYNNKDILSEKFANISIYNLKLYYLLSILVDNEILLFLILPKLKYIFFIIQLIIKILFYIMQYFLFSNFYDIIISKSELLNIYLINYRRILLLIKLDVNKFIINYYNILFFYIFFILINVVFYTIQRIKIYYLQNSKITLNYFLQFIIFSNTLFIFVVLSLYNILYIIKSYITILKTSYIITSNINYFYNIGVISNCIIIFYQILKFILLN